MVQYRGGIDLYHRDWDLLGDSWWGDGLSWSLGVGKWLAFVGLVVCVVA